MRSSGTIADERLDGVNNLMDFAKVLTGGVAA